MAFLTLEQMQGYRSPEPISEVYFVEALNVDVRIQGLVKKSEREAVFADVKVLTKAKETGSLNIRDAHGEAFTPDDDEIAAAAWCAACIVEPKTPAYEWLKFSVEGFSVVGVLAMRCWMCSRMIPYEAQVREGQEPSKEAPVPTGTDAAKEELLADPLELSGSVSASKH